MTQEFQAWPKIARLNRMITISEKLDGTNAAVVIVPLADLDWAYDSSLDGTVNDFHLTEPDLFTQVGDFGVFAQSRSRLIAPDNDNYGFAKWVLKNADALVATLGEGTHFGEWWGSGIQRKYGLTGDDKRFSLFNTKRWSTEAGLDALEGSGIRALNVVPTLYEGLYSQGNINTSIDALRRHGSFAADFPRAEGIVIFHHASRDMFKVTLEGDEAPKGEYAHRNDEERKAA